MKKVFWIILLMTAVYSSAYAKILIIANKDVPETDMSYHDVQDIFLGKRIQWSDKSKIRFVTLGNADLHSIFLKEYIKISEADWKIYWKRMVFTGKGLPPEIIADENQLIDFISGTKGAVGYISYDGIPDESEKENIIKIINIR